MKRGATDHWKMRELARLCHVPERYALAWANGTMERLWHYTAKYHPQGDIGTSPDWAICDACAWDCGKRADRPGQDSGKAAAFVAALLTAGWLDSDGRCRLIVHDWAQHADSSVKKTLENKGLSFFVPEKNNHPEKQISPAFPEPFLSSPQPIYETPKTPAPQAALVLDPPGAVRPDVPADASMPFGPVPQRKRRASHRTTEEVRRALGERCAWFDSTWEIGPWTDGKLPGMDAYERRVKERELALEVHAGAKRYSAKIAADPTIRVKFLQGWINDERWKDECQPAARPQRNGKQSFMESIEAELNEIAANGETFAGVKLT